MLNEKRYLTVWEQDPVGGVRPRSVVHTEKRVVSQPDGPRDSRAGFAWAVRPLGGRAVPRWGGAAVRTWRRWKATKPCKAHSSAAEAGCRTHAHMHTHVWAAELSGSHTVVPIVMGQLFGRPAWRWGSRILVAPDMWVAGPP